MTIKLSAWYDDLAVSVPGCPIPAMEMALHRTFKEFLRRSGAWAKEVPGIRLKAGKDTYTIPKQPEGPILFLYGLYYEGHPLRPALTEEWLSKRPFSGTAPAFFRRYLEDPGRITVAPTPQSDLTSLLIPHVAFGYSKDCQENLLDLFGTHWYEAILSGAIYHLCSQGGKPYTDPTIAAFHGKQFRAGIATARDQARKQFTRTETPFSFPAWA